MQIQYKGCQHEYFWYPATNEDGWRCCACDHKPGEPPGFDPQRDRDEIWTKVWCLVHHLHEAGLIYVSNSSMGEGLASRIADACVEANRFDQYTIVRMVLQGLAPSHAEYWSKISEGILSGNDPRERCPCGELSICTTYAGGKEPKHRCKQHLTKAPEVSA